jgi:hypothetical protein
MMGPSLDANQAQGSSLFVFTVEYRPAKTETPVGFQMDPLKKGKPSDALRKAL